MGKTVEDVEDLLDVLVDHTKTKASREDYRLAMKRKRLCVYKIYGWFHS